MLKTALQAILLRPHFTVQPLAQTAHVSRLGAPLGASRPATSSGTDFPDRCYANVCNLTLLRGCGHKAQLERL
jgi:hypothetical protein